MLIKSYRDESYDNDILCVAGYTFTSRNARLLDAAWRSMLMRYKRLPYFRMSACNAHKYPFDRLTESECIAVATEAIALISRFASFGYAATVNQKAFNKIITNKGFVSTPYEFCAWFCLIAARSGADKHNAIGPMSFFFESGFEHQSAANRMMNNIFHSPKLRDYYRYKAHIFMDKTDCRPTQAADLLAWQWYKAATRMAKSRSKPRGDLAALFAGTPHYVMHADAAQLQWLVNAINATAGSPIGNEIAGIAMKTPSSPLFPKRPGESGDPAEYERLKKLYPEKF